MIYPLTPREEATEIRAAGLDPYLSAAEYLSCERERQRLVALGQTGFKVAMPAGFFAEPLPPGFPRHGVRSPCDAPDRPGGSCDYLLRRVTKLSLARATQVRRGTPGAVRCERCKRTWWRIEVHPVAVL